MNANLLMRCVVVNQITTADMRFPRKHRVPANPSILKRCNGDQVPRSRSQRSLIMSTILIILLILLLVGALPSWPYSRSWGYFPSGLLGLVLVIVIVLFLLGRL